MNLIRILLTKILYKNQNLRRLLYDKPIEKGRVGDRTYDGTAYTIDKDQLEKFFKMENIFKMTTSP